MRVCPGSRVRRYEHVLRSQPPPYWQRAAVAAFRRVGVSGRGGVPDCGAGGSRRGDPQGRQESPRDGTVSRRRCSCRAAGASSRSRCRSNAAFDALFLPAAANTGEDEQEVADDDLGVSFYKDDAIDLGGADARAVLSGAADEAAVPAGLQGVVPGLRHQSQPRDVHVSGRVDGSAVRCVEAVCTDRQ